MSLPAPDPGESRLLLDPRIRAIEWKDLARLSPLESMCELVLSLPWLVLSLWLASLGLWPLALGASFLFFLTGLRQAHDAQHYNLGLSRRAHELVLFGLSILMLGSMHAVQYNHLRHHRHCMGDDDVEARSARMRWWQALAWGPVFPILLHRSALCGGTARQRVWIATELAANVLVIAAVILWPLGAVRYHVLAMLAGHCLTAFFAVWTVHHDVDPERELARTLRNPLKSAIAFDMFFHVEHHLFPKVPTRHLPELARRLERIAPELGRKQVY